MRFPFASIAAVLLAFAAAVPAFAAGSPTLERVKKNGYAGMFNWQEMTDDNGELRAAMRDSLD